MKITGSYGPKRTRRTRIIAITTAAMITIMLLTQLFEYEDFAVTLSSLLPLNNSSTYALAAAVIVIAELLALPYLLGVYLSKLMRIASGFFVAAISVFWLLTSLTNSHAGNSGLFSTTIDLTGGIIATAWSLALFAGVVLVVRADTQTTATPLEKKS